ncbi:MAG: DEAD/DEAH box helicase [Patescibacteria group bacterium]
MDIQRIIRAVEAHPSYRGQIVACRRAPAAPSRYAAPEPPLRAELAEALGRQGIGALYEHQAAALTAIGRGQHVVVETPTASGKSLCFHLPVIAGLADDPGARALYLFPTKALARDQLAKLGALAPGVPAGAYDADTPRSERRRLREEASLILTNPDLLHMGILPYHLHWGKFFGGLRYVVVDEIHTYRGVFGTHIGHVLRRLRRVAAAHGAQPLFIMASATIANPAEHAEALLGAPVNLIHGGGAPRGERAFLLWDAYRRPLRERTAQSAYLEDAAWLLALLIEEGVRTIAFTRSRQAAEWLQVSLARLLEGSGQGELAAKVRSYRGGYLPSERRAIERQLFTGELLGVVSTSALELGVDIGGLEAALILGYPGTMASLWQQAGRAGRGGEPSLCIFAPGPNLLERYLLQHPDYFFGRPFERALIDPANPYILQQHLRAAAFEWPLGPEDASLWGGMGTALADLLADEGMLTKNAADGRWYYAGADYPAEGTSLRGGGGSLRLEAGGRTIGTIDAAGAAAQVHPGAIYLHAGERYVVAALDEAGGVVRLEPAVGDYLTQAMSETGVAVTVVHREKTYGPARVRLGEVRVTSRITGYVRRDASTGAALGNFPLAMTPSETETVGFWLVFPPSLAGDLAGRGLDPAGGLHGLEHLLIGLLPLVVLCDSSDVAGSSTVHHADAGGPAVFLYDAAPGGVGYSERAYDGLADLIARAGDALAACSCARGCPSCIQSPACGSHNQPLDKSATKEILARLQNVSS